MATIGIELGNVGFQAARCDKTDPQLLASAGGPDWPGYACHDGKKYSFGRAAEDAWFVLPRQVCPVFGDKLSHESSPLNVAGRHASFSELAFYFLREYTQHLAGAAGPLEKVVLAVPSAFLKDAATEEQKIGLLLGMAAELKLPLAGVVDMAAASLCDSRGAGFNPAHPVVVVDMHLTGADLTLHVMEKGRLERRDLAHLSAAGYGALLKHLTAAMGNRFLKATAFDILEDGSIEQAFFRQTKDFLLSGAPEHRYQLNTARRAYEMTGTHEQLVVDAQTYATMLLHGVQSLVQKLPDPAEPVTVALSARAATLPGLDARLRAAGFLRLLRLPAGAAACGAARMGEELLPARKELDEIHGEVSVPQSAVKNSQGAPWEANLQKPRATGPRLRPSHIVIDGLGHGVGGAGAFAIGSPSAGPDLALPEAFNAAEDCLVQLQREAGRLWLLEPGPATGGAAPARTLVEAGDRLVVRCGNAVTDLLFVHCHDPAGMRR
ncbi:MAG: hypothetical protein HYX71_13500 [Opitutae bacterium]|nr:hypothetical protein [Opitutae bacterium]